MNQIVNKKNSKNSSNSLVFGQWRRTKIQPLRLPSHAQTFVKKLEQVLVDPLPDVRVIQADVNSRKILVPALGRNSACHGAHDRVLKGPEIRRHWEALERLQKQTQDSNRRIYKPTNFGLKWAVDSLELFQRDRHFLGWWNSTMRSAS